MIMKLQDKLVKVSDTFEVTQYDNGFRVEVRGENAEGNWRTAQILAADKEAVKELFDEYCDMELTD